MMVLSTLKKYRITSLFVLATLFLYYRRKNRLKSLQKTAILQGQVSSGFERVRDKCMENILLGREKGVQVCCYHKGERVVDVTGGACSKTRLWPESLSVVFSCTKVMESLVISMLVDRGLLSYDDRISKHWPEFGESICSKLTVKDLMRHQSGLSGVSEPISLEILNNPEMLARELLRQKCVAWDIYDTSEKAKDIAAKEHTRLMKKAPVDGFTDVSSTTVTGSRRQGYNAVTRGFWSGELVRRVDPNKRTLSEFFEDEVASKLEGIGGRDFYIGCPKSEQVRCIHPDEESVPSFLARVATHMLLPRWLSRTVYGDFDHLYEYEVMVIKNMFRKKSRELALRSYMVVDGIRPSPKDIALPEVRSVPMASVTGVANARSMATILSQVACSGTEAEKVRIISRSGLNAALETEFTMVDEIISRPVTYTAAGWGSDRFEFVGAKGWYGWAGLGGSMLLFNPTTQSSFAYVPSLLSKRLYKPRGMACLKEFIAAIENLEQNAA